MRLLPDGFYTLTLDTAIEVWPQLYPLLKRCCDTTRGKYTPATLLEHVAEQSMQLWVYIEDTEILGACFTAVQVYKTGRKEVKIIIGTGYSREKWQGFRKIIELWAKDVVGANGINSEARKGWAKVFNDYKLTHVLLEKEF